ncbi:hypothetical protein ACSSS7_001809 [Eimeria intestinalis]
MAAYSPQGQKTAGASDPPTDAPTTAAHCRGSLQGQGPQDQQQQQQQQQHELQQNALFSELLLRRCLSSHLPPSSPEFLASQPQSFPWASLLSQTGLDSLTPAKHQQHQQQQQQVEEDVGGVSLQRRCRGGTGQPRGPQRCEQKQAGSPLCKRAPQSPVEPPSLALPKGTPHQGGLLPPLSKGPLSAGGGGPPTPVLAARADITLGGNKPHYHVAKQEWRVRYYMSGKRKMRTYSAKFYGYEAAHSMAKDFAAYVDTHEALPLQQLLPPPSAGASEVKASPNVQHRRISLLQQHHQAALTAAAAAAAGGTPSRQAAEGPTGVERQEGGGSSFLGGGPTEAETATRERLQSQEQTACKVDTEETALCLQLFLKEYVRDKLRSGSKGPRPSQQDSLGAPLGGPLESLLGGERPQSNTSFYYSNTSSSSCNEAEGQQPTENGSRNNRSSSSSSSSSATSAASLHLRKAPPSAAATGSAGSAGAASAAGGKGAAGIHLTDLLQLGSATGAHPTMSSEGPLPPSELLTFSKIVIELTSSTCLLLFELKEAIAKALLLVETDANPPPAAAPAPAAAAAADADGGGGRAAQKCGSTSMASSPAGADTGETTISAVVASQEVVVAPAAEEKQATRSTIPCPSSTKESAAESTVGIPALQAPQQQQQQEQQQRQLEAAVKHDSPRGQQQKRQQQRAEEAVRRAFALLARHQKLAAAITQLQLPIPVYLHCLIKATSQSFLPLVLPNSSSNNSSSTSSSSSSTIGSQQQEGALVIDSESALQALFLRPFDVYRCRCSERPCACDQQHLARMLSILSLILSKAQQGRGAPEGGATSEAVGGQRGCPPDPIQLLSRIIPGITAKESLQQKQQQQQQQQQHVCVAAAASCSSSTLPSSASPNTTCRCSPVTSPDVFMTLRPTAPASAAAAASGTGETPEALQLPPHQGTPVTTTSAAAATGACSAAAEEQGNSSSCPEQTLADVLGAALVNTTKALGPEASVQFQEQLLQHRWQKHTRQQQLLLPPRLPYRSMLALVPPLQSLLHTLAQVIMHRHWNLVASYIKSSCPSPQAEVLLDLHGHALQTLNPAAAVAAAGDAVQQEAPKPQTHTPNNNNDSSSNNNSSSNSNSSSSRGTTATGTGSNTHQSLTESCSISADAAACATAATATATATAAATEVLGQDHNFAPLKRKWLAGGEGERQREGSDAAKAAGAAASAALLPESPHHQEVSLEKLLS